MMPKVTSLTWVFVIELLLFVPLISGQSCKNKCGNISIKYPFGSGLGCGDPRFQRSLNCNQGKLEFVTRTGHYQVTSIDYARQVIHITDPSMSTCKSSHSSSGFGLDWDAPFIFSESVVFALIDCSTSSSPMFKTNSKDKNATGVPQCDRTGAPICNFLYSCRAISVLNHPISSCCVYAPVDLGPSFEMDLRKLKCSSYAAFYSVDGQVANPDNWEYGIALKYKFSVYNDYPSDCASCEKSKGVCGYGTPYSSDFICNCGDGFNTTTDCSFTTAFNGGGSRLHLWNPGVWKLYALASFLAFGIF